MDAKQALQSAQLYTDDTDYIMISLPPSAIMAAAGVLAEIGEPFGTVIADKDEVSLVIPVDAYEEFQGRLPGARVSAPMRLLTFDLVLPMEMTGFMALVSGLLAEADIPIMPIAAFERDHLLIEASQIANALAVLRKAQTS
jgi:hypothetical protein